MMLMVPASKVSVPFAVVMRTRSRVPERETEPAVKYICAELEAAIEPEQAQVFPPRLLIVIAPCAIAVENHCAVLTPMPNPVLKFDVATPPAVVVFAPRYPLVVMLPAPIWICGGEVPLVETPLNITVTRFAHEGMPVKSMDVPEVEATAVPSVRAPPWIVLLEIVAPVIVLFVKVCVASVPTSVVAASGSMIVRFEFVLGASRITVPVPDAFPLTVRLDML